MHCNGEIIFAVLFPCWGIFLTMHFRLIEYQSNVLCVGNVKYKSWCFSVQHTAKVSTGISIKSVVHALAEGLMIFMFRLKAFRPRLVCPSVWRSVFKARFAFNVRGPQHKGTNKNNNNNKQK